jgi:RHS repeat-associated protein
MKATTGGTTTVYVYDATGQVAAEYSTAAPPQVGTLYLTPDHLGSTRLETNDLGAAVAYHDYLPFGEEIPGGLGGRGSLYGAVDGQTHKFTGKERDALETGGSAMQGLDYFGARYFSAAQGRFTSPDPVIVTPARMQDPQRFNLYSYARNNPFKFIDPNGEDIDFANDTEEGRKKAFALITRNLSAAEAANIGIRQAKGGAYEAYVIDTKAVGKDASGAYRQLTGLINDHSIVADVGVIGGGLTATFSQGALAGVGSVRSWSEQDSVFAPPAGSSHVNVLVTQGDLPGGTQVWCCNGKAVYQGVQPDFVTMWHELVGETLKYRAGHQNLLHNPGLDSRTVIKIENEIRAAQGMNPRTGADHGETVITVNGKVQ